MKTKDWLLFCLVGIIWGTSFLWIKIAVQEISPVLLVGYRTLFASIGLGLIWLFTFKNYNVRWIDVRNRLLDFSIMGAINIAFPWLLFSWAGNLIDSGTSSVLNGAMPLFTILISPIFIADDHLTLPKVIGLLTGFVGVVVLMLPSLDEGWSASIAGQAGVLLATIFYAAGAVFARKRSQGFPPQFQALMQLSLGSLITWVIALFFVSPILLPVQPLTWIATLWLGLIGSCLAFIIYFKLLHQIGPIRTSSVTYISPLIGVLLGILFLGEQFSWYAVIGTVFILSGVTIVNMRVKIFT
jgi:drug/metabolite transporter (DMT)-like permease